MTRTPSKRTTRSIQEFLGADHKRCDELFSQLEQAAQANDVTQAALLFGQFRTGMDHHFGMEENIFFPAFEKSTGMTQGPTMVMRMEHRQMSGLIGQMAQAMEQNKLDGVTRVISTLVIMMRQHNIKEEQMLYPMADQYLDGTTDSLIRTMQKLV
ncbi:MAG: hemerythrin domain-containing protein [Magnetococcales bacterium]|nr:hemerythrin domain-containing protein [Magnetococcales bacterium]